MVVLSSSSTVSGEDDEIHPGRQDFHGGPGFVKRQKNQSHANLCMVHKQRKGQSM